MEGAVMNLRVYIQIDWSLERV